MSSLTMEDFEKDYRIFFGSMKLAVWNENVPCFGEHDPGSRIQRFRILNNYDANKEPLQLIYLNN